MRNTKKHGLFHQLYLLIRENKISFTVYVVLELLVLCVLIRCAFNAQWESVFVCVLTLLLFLLPPFVEKTFSIRLPTTLEVIAFLFIFCAEILGEINLYYEKVPIWDTMLHTVNGFVFAAVGFSLVDIFNKSDKFKFQLSPLFLAIVAFCFSMTIGVLWEFFEFSADVILKTDMQKDVLVEYISSTSLDPLKSNTPVIIDGITSTTLTTASGDVYTISSYLDIGLIDTMKDLFVNFVGAVVFSIIGYIYVKQRGKGKIANQFIPVFVERSDIE